MNNDYWELAERLVPDHGVADTVQGELVRAVLRLTTECFRNGCGNWGSYEEALTEFATDKFSDGSLEAGLAERARTILERLRDYGRSVGDPEFGPLNTGVPLADEEKVYRGLCDDMDEPLEEATMEWCRQHPIPIPFQPSPDYGAAI